MINNIKNEFKLIVNEIKWMDEESKRKVLIKVDLMREKIGFPDYIFNNSYLDRNLYNDYNFNEKNYFNNFINVRLLELKSYYRRLGKVDNNQYFILQ
jgi:membrane metallo-endopeptidase-like protein 1